MDRVALASVAVWLVAVLPRALVRDAVVAPIWQVAGEGRGVPAVSGSNVYFLTKRHEVIAVDGAAGTVCWRRNTGEPGDETLGSSVIVSDDVVMAGDYAILAFDASTGMRRWRFDPTDGYGPGLYLGGAADGVAFAGSPSGRLYGVTIADGKPRWSVQPVDAPKTTVFQPILAGDVVISGYTTFDRPIAGGLVVVDRASGRERWHRAFPPATAEAATGFGGGPVVLGGLVIAASGDGRIHAFDRETGLPRWVLPAVVRADGRPQDRDWRALALSGSSLVAGSVTGILTMIDVGARQERWRYAHPEGGSIGLRIAADAGSVYVPHLGGRLVALRARDGRKLWEIGGFSDGFNWAPAVARQRIYAAASRTGLFALPR
jgi:outer membrane protein assembly factor BamB